MVDKPMTSGHPRHYLAPVMHSPIRLSILAVLAEVEEAEFRFVAETVEVNAATLSRQVTVLDEAGLVHIRKGQAGRRSRTWLSLSDHGRQSFAEYLTALRAITGTGSPQDREE
jgi:DNA-binding MarR family transcriptional regulator